MFHRGWFQVAVRDAGLSEAIRRTLSQYSTARLSSPDVAAWPELGDTRRFAGVIAEHGPGFESWASSLRERAPSLPILALLSQVDPARLGSLQAHCIEVAALPLHTPHLVSFAQRCQASDFVPHDRVARLVAHLADARGLTAREVQLLSFWLGDEPRARVRRRLGISENTLKTQIRALLRKCGERNADALAKNVLRVALLGERAAAGAEALAPWYPALAGAA